MGWNFDWMNPASRGVGCEFRYLPIRVERAALLKMVRLRNVHVVGMDTASSTAVLAGASGAFRARRLTDMAEHEVAASKVRHLHRLSAGGELRQQVLCGRNRMR